MIYFHNDYSEGCHEKVLENLIQTNMEQTPGYGMDEHCMAAAQKIKAACRRSDVDVHFLVGGTQANLTVIDAALRPHQGALCAVSGHINVHETGAVEATGHKVLAVPTEDGKLNAATVDKMVVDHFSDEAFEHIASTTPDSVAIKQVVPISEPDNTTAIRIIIFTGSCFSL